MVTIKCHFGAERHGARHQAPCLYLVMMEMKCQNSGTVSSYVVSVMQWRWLWLQQSGCWQISFGSRDVKVKGVLWRRQRRMKCLMIEFWVWVRVFKYTNRHYIFNWADVSLERASCLMGRAFVVILSCRYVNWISFAVAVEALFFKYFYNNLA